LDAEQGGVVWRTVIKELKSQRYFQIFALSPDGRVAALKDYFGTVRLLDLASGEELRSAQNPSIQPIILGADFSSDGRTLATADASGVVGLWDVATLERYATLDGHRNSARAVVFLPDGTRVISAGGDEDAVIFWDLQSRQELLRLPAEGTMSQLEFCPERNLLIALNLNGDLYAWRAPP
jgi:WD40 repeat protein